MNKWSNLPNARHIDWVIQSVKDNPREWDTARAAVYNAAWASAHDAAYNAAYDAEKYAARGAALGAAKKAAGDAAWYAAYAAILALVEYDGIEHYFFSSYEELRLISELSQHPAAILLLPVVKVRELIEAKNERVV